MPKPKTGKATRPKTPDGLDGEALLEWDRVCGELESLGTLDATDRALITAYAETWATWHKATAHVAMHGAVIKCHNNIAGQNPFYKVAKETAAMLRAFLSDMGLTPAARHKAKASSAGDQPNDDLEF